jgi:hypothetical protein
VQVLDFLFSDIGEDEGVAIRAFNDQGVKQFLVKDGKYQSIIDKYRRTHNLWFGVSSSSSKSHSKEDVVKAYALWCDLDDPDLDVNHINFALPPSMVISSGRGYHCYWKLDTPQTDFDLVEELNRYLLDFLGGDKGTQERTRLLRIDDTFNFKYDDPKPVTVVYRRDYVYSVDDIVAATDLDAAILHKIVTGTHQGYTSRSERDYAVIAACVQEGISDNAIQAIFDYHEVGERYREKTGGDRYLLRSIENARESVGVHLDRDTPKGLSRRSKEINGIVRIGYCYWQVMSNGKKKSVRLS